MRARVRGLAALALLLAAGSGLVAWRLSIRPDLSRYDRYALPPAPPGAPGRRVTVTFLGVATLLFSDGETSVMTDGWFTRVPLLDALTRRPVAPDLEAIGRGLARAGVSQLAAVLPVHSHYDHAMDSPEVARRTGALLAGSRSTAWIGRGAGLAEDRIRVVEPGVPLRFGDFTVTHVASRHVELPFGMGALGRELDAPLVPPAPVDAWVEGGSFSILIQHPLGTALVQGSAGFVPGALAPYSADAVFLGLGGLARQGADYTGRYLAEVVDAVEARRVIPIHYDDLAAPADGPLAPMPRLLDDVEASFERVEAHAEADPQLELALAPKDRPVVLFAE
jgi:L-ascorbate metabolism protein UlaG (beta-lactamase superfamily)